MNNSESQKFDPNNSSICGTTLPGSFTKTQGQYTTNISSGTTIGPYLNPSYTLGSSINPCYGGVNPYSLNAPQAILNPISKFTNIYCGSINVTFENVFLKLIDSKKFEQFCECISSYKANSKEVDLYIRETDTGNSVHHIMMLKDIDTFSLKIKLLNNSDFEFCFNETKLVDFNFENNNEKVEYFKYNVKFEYDNMQMIKI